MTVSTVVLLLLIISLCYVAVKFGYSQSAICKETKAKMEEYAEVAEELREGYDAVLKREYLYTGCFISGIAGVVLFMTCQLLKLSM